MALKAVKQFTLTTVDGIKSIPIHQFPADAWRNLFGSTGGMEDGRTLKYQLYEAVPWLYRGVNTIVEAVIGLPRNDEDLETLDLRVDWSAFLNEIVGDYLFTGAMFCIIESNRYGKNRELRRLHPDTMKPEADEGQGLTGFTRTLGTKEISFKRDELGYTWIPSRDTEIAIGTAPVNAALAAAGLLYNIDEYGQKYFKSGAINPTLVEFDNWETYPEAEKKRTKNILRRMFQGGINKAHEVLPIGANAKVHTLGNPLSELAVPELTDKKREDISTALGIPQSLLFSQAANYATAHQDDQHFYDKTIVPLARKIEGMLNPYFLQMGISTQLEFHEQEMELYQKDEASRSDSLVNLINAGIPLITAMEILGYDLDDEQWRELRQAITPDEPMVIQDNPTPVINDTADTQGDPSMMSISTFRQVNTIATDLDKWQRKATKYFRKYGTADVDFESDLIPPTLAAAIEGHLIAVDNREDIATVFEHAIRLTDHHNESGVY